MWVHFLSVPISHHALRLSFQILSVPASHLTETHWGLSYLLWGTIQTPEAWPHPHRWQQAGEVIAEGSSRDRRSSVWSWETMFNEDEQQVDWGWWESDFVFTTNTHIALTRSSPLDVSNPTWPVYIRYLPNHCVKTNILTGQSSQFIFEQKASEEK